MQNKKTTGPLNEEELDCYSPSNDCLNIYFTDIKQHLYRKPRYNLHERIKTCIQVIYFILAFIGIASAGLLGPMADVPPADAVPLNWRPMQVRSPLGDWVDQYQYEY